MHKPSTRCHGRFTPPLPALGPFSSTTTTKPKRNNTGLRFFDFARRIHHE
jgi:hypothetical protein